ncbi:sigma-E processing peptidase SpoIIGA [Alkaliphilus peptidifermentans]|uniref:Sporulation sigma-E factor-processing peptidase n=1 Tax=Alkaliphilus peptidifermentans DSM 18978 TaxID=1120976 RepID=A0A1G5BDF7_9FIRM|nr:sigma-E processing peptidase SpoIIGA [Alkaliphilus peptidifermentans]SCX88159.1 sporulation factor SpoIIGA. Unknown type peptidase. MEROPS family U04 [Alkaliphilus peptidifermentans DSM 18978]
MIVYAEYVFLENFIMNYIILSLTSKFGKAIPKRFQIAIASSIGALYAFIIFFPSLHFLFSFIMKIACSMFIIVIAFTPYRFKDFFRLLGIFYLITIIFGGAGFALFYFTNFNGIISNGIFYITNISVKNIILSCGIGYILINFCWGYVQKQLTREKILMKVKIHMNGEVVELIGMVDTGNSLIDPITHYPVMIVEFDAILNLLPEDIHAIFLATRFPNYNEISSSCINASWITRLRIIPYEALGTENGMLVGFKPDGVIIEKDSQIKNINDIIIAIYSKKLSKTGDYRALLHPDLV